MELELYTALKAHIQTELPQIKTVGLFNNQFQHLLSAHPDENPFLYPCVFIGMKPHTFKDLGMGVQEFDLSLTTHLGYESYKTEAEEILALKQQLYLTVQRFQNGYFTKLLRREETPDFNHPNIQVYQTTYTTHGKDYSGDLRNKTITTTARLALTATTSFTGFTAN
jgi:hypothetical protein